MVALVDHIILTVTTGDEEIDSNERVFLGIGGREFRCRRQGDHAENPFHEKNKKQELRFGSNSNVEDPELNDPRSGQHMSGGGPIEKVNRHKIYLRRESTTDSRWTITTANVEVFDASDEFLTPVPNGSVIDYPGITLSKDSGHMVTF